MSTPSRTVAAGSSAAEFKEKGSRFLGLLDPATDEEAARATVERYRLRFPDATHHCWAWRVGTEPFERSHDDGEPSGTAGLPMLRVLQGAAVEDVVAVVVRWYGGTKLGKGGLARAYAGAVRQALETLPTTEQLLREQVDLTLAYQHLGAVERLVQPPQLEILSASYGAEITMTLAATSGKLEQLQELAAGLGFRCAVAPQDRLASSEGASRLDPTS